MIPYPFCKYRRVHFSCKVSYLSRYLCFWTPTSGWWTSANDILLMLISWTSVSILLSVVGRSVYLSVELGFIGCFLHFMHICHARHYSTLRNVHYRKRRRRRLWNSLSGLLH